MKSRTNKIMVASLATALGLFWGATQAMGATTPPNTTIGNTATISYSVNSVNLSATGSASFIVDEKIALEVTNNNDDYVTVYPGENGNGNSRLLKFTITNNGNIDLNDIQLSPEQFNNVALPDNPPYTDSDNFDVSSIIFYEDDGTGTPTTNQITGLSLTYDNGTDPYQTIVWVGVTVPDDTADGAVAGLHLIATANGVDSKSSSATDLVDVVYADAAGSASGDDLGDATHSDYGAVKVSAPNMTVTKEAITGNTGGYFIPGDTVTYKITVKNEGSVVAGGVIISDPIPGNTTYAGSLDCTGLIDSTGNETDDGSGTITDVSCEGGTIAAGETGIMTFKVTID